MEAIIGSGGGITVPTGREAQLVEEDGFLVARGSGTTRLDDDVVFTLLDAGRR